MSKDMNISVNGQSRVPPGFRFHPTEEELLHYYLKKKVDSEKIDLDVIRDVDLNKLEPWDIQEKCRIGSTPQTDWYFFSHKDKKYPTGPRTNRATAAGFWKATGRDKVIHCSLKRIGMRKTLVFYKGRAPNGQISDWIMHEYRLDDTTHDTTGNNLTAGAESVMEEGWVVCRVFKKKNYNNKVIESSSQSQGLLSTSTDIRTHLRNISSKNNVVHQYMGGSCCKQEMTSQTISSTNTTSMLYLPSTNATIEDRFTHLPRLEIAQSPNHKSLWNQEQSSFPEQGSRWDPNTIDDCQTRDGLVDWASLDRFVASQLNGQDVTSKDHLSCYGEPDDNFCFPSNTPNVVVQRSQDYGGEIDLWSLISGSPASSSSDPVGHLSV